MKIAKNCFIEQACTADPTRLAVNRPYLQGSTLIATDGYMLVAVPIELESGDVDGYVPVKILKASRAGKKKELASIILTDKKSAESEGVIEPRNPSDSIFPNWQQVVPKANRDVTFKIGLDAALLGRLSDAMGGSDDKLILEFVDDRQAIVVKKISAPDVLAILMPTRLP